MWIRYRWPASDKYLSKIIVPFTICTILFILTVSELQIKNFNFSQFGASRADVNICNLLISVQAGVYVNLYVFSLMDGMMVLAGFVVAFAGYAVGGLLAWACRHETQCPTNKAFAGK